MASDTTHDTAPSSQIIPAFCLIGVVALLSSITPTMKYVLQHSSLTFLSIANGRIVIDFLFLAAVTACFDGKGLRSLGIADSVRFGLLGLLGVGSYVVAAYGLLYTNVTHYALIYSLLPTFPPFSAGAFPKIRLPGSSVIGIVLSWGGCLHSDLHDRHRSSLARGTAHRANAGRSIGCFTGNRVGTTKASFGSPAGAAAPVGSV